MSHTLVFLETNLSYKEISRGCETFIDPWKRYFIAIHQLSPKANTLPKRKEQKRKAIFEILTNDLKALPELQIFLNNFITILSKADDFLVIDKMGPYYHLTIAIPSNKKMNNTRKSEIHFNITQRCIVYQ